MTLDECIAYLENVSSERKPRSRKARQIIKYLKELKERRRTLQSICDSLRHEFYGYDSETDYYAGYDDGIKIAMTMIESERGEDGRE